MSCTEMNEHFFWPIIFFRAILFTINFTITSYNIYNQNKRFNFRAILFTINFTIFTIKIKDSTTVFFQIIHEEFPDPDKFDHHVSHKILESYDAVPP